MYTNNKNDIVLVPIYGRLDYSTPTIISNNKNNNMDAVIESLLLNVNPLNEVSLTKEDLKKLMTRFDDNMDKALKITLANKRGKERRDVAEDFTVLQFLDEFSLDIASLKRLLKDTTIVIGDGNNVYSDDMLLRDFCTKNGYDYDLVSLMIKIKRDGLDSNDLLLASYTNCVYGKMTLLKSILEYSSISSRSVVDEMKNNGILVDQALINVCFRKKSR